MATTPTNVLAFADFERLPNPREGRYELHHGELVHMPPPKLQHYDLQRRLRRLLERCAGNASGWEIDIEMAFRPLPEYEYWVADVAAVSAGRYREGRALGYLQGPPELVVEVLSPSNTSTEMEDKCETCLGAGARQFWIVNPVRRTVEVSTPDSRSIRYHAGESIPLLVGGTLSVDEIFAID